MNREHVFFDMFEPHPFHKSTLNLFILIQTTGFCVNSSSNMATMRWRSADFVNDDRCHTKTTARVSRTSSVEVGFVGSEAVASWV